MVAKSFTRVGTALGALCAAFAFGAAPAHAGTTASYGPYLIANNVTGKCVDIPGLGAGPVNGPVNQYTCDGSANDNQRFWFDHQATTSNGTALYTIRNSKDGLCLDVPDYGNVPAGAKVSEYWCRPSGDNQLYWLSTRPDGHNWLVNYVSGLCLDVDGVRTGGNDARLTLYYCSDTDDHHWQLLA
ncbi:RICIN domain-containing protein [Streptomyces sp. NBC_00335]|uniref:RICIN domain-containing protein n=1 Tax=unclassified Streptomyces TaxID=2593676 RepID=UPI00225127D1|nr:MULTISPECIES: RICIN domain-containing protein [unclassified Streptomyces]MCX5409820.1 RICIN domain-containing protein [Streptomyces sp. NBC_00086]